VLLLADREGRLQAGLVEDEGSHDAAAVEGAQQGGAGGAGDAGGHCRGCCAHGQEVMGQGLEIRLLVRRQGRGAAGLGY